MADYGDKLDQVQQMQSMFERTSQVLAEIERLRLEALVEAYEEGASQKTLAKLVHMDDRRLRQQLHKIGVQLRGPGRPKSNK